MALRELQDKNFEILDRIAYLPVSPKDRAVELSVQFAMANGLTFKSFSTETLANNQIVHLKDADDRPIASAKCYSDETKAFLPRSVDFFRLLEKHGFGAQSNGEIGFSTITAVDELNNIVLTSHEVGNLSKADNMGDFLSKVLKIFAELRKLDDPNEFKHTSLKKDTIGNYLQFAAQRFEVFEYFLSRLADPPTESLHEDAEILVRIIEQRGLAGKLEKRKQEIYALCENRMEEFLNDLVCLDTCDQSPQNLMYSKDDNGKSKVSLIDGDYAQPQSQLLSVAIFSTHPSLRFYFQNPEQRREYITRFLTDYARENKLTDEQISRLNLLLRVSNFVWGSVLAKNISVGRKNWRELFGGIYRSRMHAVTSLDIPILDEMLSEETVQISREGVDSGETLQTLVKPLSKKLHKPLTKPNLDTPPTTEFERWASEIIKEDPSFSDNSNQGLTNCGAIPMSNQELASEPYLWQVSVRANHLGGGIVHATNTYSSFYADQITGFRDGWTKKDYGFLTETSEHQRSSSSRLFVLSNKPLAEVQVDDVQDELGITPEVLAKIQALSRFPERFSSMCKSLERFCKTDSINTNRQIKNVDIDESNGEYYSIVTFTLADDTKLAFKVNRIGSEGSRGAIFVVKNEGKYKLITNTRPIIFPHQDDDNKEEWECPRGFTTANASSDVELLHETGLPLNSVVTTETVAIKEDTLVSASEPLIHFVNVTQNTTRQPEVKYNDFIFADPFETIRGSVELTPEQALAAIAENRLHDSYTIAALTMDMIKSGNLISPDIPVYLVFQETFNVARGTRELTLVDAPIEEGQDFGYVDPDNGTQRRRYHLGVATPEEAIKSGKKLVTLTLSQTVEKITKGDFDAPTTALLSKAMVRSGLLAIKS